MTSSSPVAHRYSGQPHDLGRKDRILDVRVDDVTGDDATDFTVGGILCNMDVIYPSVSDKPYYFGYGNFRKTGAGTMSITHPDNTFTGNVEIAEGTLRLDNTSSPNIRDGYNYRCSTLGAWMATTGRSRSEWRNMLPETMCRSARPAADELQNRSRGGRCTLGQTQNNFGLSLEGRQLLVHKRCPGNLDRYGDSR